MRIISDFRDYYDSAVGHGFDPDLVYNRKTRWLDLPQEQLRHYNTGKLDRVRSGWLDTWEPDRWADWTSPGASGLCYIGFCGRVYPAVAVGTFDDVGCASYRWCYDLESLKSGRELAEQSKPRKRVFRPDWMVDVEVQALNTGPIEDQQVFQDLNSPIFLALAPSFGLSGQHSAGRPYLPVGVDLPLYGMGFARLFDAYTAFQELSMFLSGVLGWPGPAVQDVPEEYRLAAHGYNEQSFRKTGPTGRKARKKARKGRA